MRKIPGNKSTAKESDRALDELNLNLGRYMIALAGAFQSRYYDEIPAGKPTFFSFPGFVLAVSEKRFFVTAGHNLRAIAKENEEIHTDWMEMVWVQFVPDSEGPATHSVDNTTSRHLNFECDVTEHRDCNDASGTQDWGVLKLTATEWKWMETSGVVSFGLDDLRSTSDADAYILMGLPIDLFDQLTIEKDIAVSAVNPTIISLQIRDDLIERTKGLWFVGKLPEKEKISIRGMSGGPLFAINCDSWELWITGVQSHWCPESRIAFVCPTKMILDHFSDH